MGVDLPRTSRELLPPGVVRAVAGSRTGPRPWWPLGLAVVAAALLPLARDAGAGTAVRALLWTLPPLAAVLAWVRARSRARGRLRTASVAFALAAGVGVVAHLAWSYEIEAGTGMPVALYLLVLPHLLLALGASLALAGREPDGSAVDVVSDALLLQLAAVVGILRWVVEPLLAGAGGAGPQTVALAVLQSVAVLPVVPAGLVLLQRRTWLLPRAAALLLGATLLFATAALGSLMGADPRPLVREDPTDLIAMAGWLALAASGASARGPASSARAMLLGRRLRERLRRVLVPGVALFLAVVAVDLAAGARPVPATVLAVAALGGLLTLRTAHAFSLVSRDEEQGLRLAHTRALVEVTHALAGTTDLDETLRVISESARAVLGTRAAGIELVTEDGQELVTRATVGLPPEVLGLRFPVQGSFTGWVVRHGEPRATVDPTLDPYIQPQSLVFLGNWPVAAAPIRFRGETLGALFACIRTEPFELGELHLIGALAEQAAIAIQNARLFEQVMVLSVTDPLTGLPNRRQLERELSREFAAAGRGRDLVAVIFDLDGFKHYNDAHGHLAGDEALQAFATTLEAETRAMNFAARYGGDEFVALLGGADAAGARVFVQRIRDRFRIASLALGRGEISVSEGMAAWAPDMDHPDELLRRADDELYRSKARLRT